MQVCLTCCGCCGQGNAGFRTCICSGAFRKPSCLGRQACKDAYMLSWNLRAEYHQCFPSWSYEWQQRKMSQSLVEANLLCRFQKLHWKELKGGKWRLEMGSTRQISKCRFLNVRFSSLCLSCWRLKCAFVSVLSSPLPTYFLLFKLSSQGEGVEKMEPNSSQRHIVKEGVAIGRNSYKEDSGWVLQDIFFTVSIAKQFGNKASHPPLFWTSLLLPWHIKYCSTSCYTA